MTDQHVSTPCENCGKVNRADVEGLCPQCAWKAGLISTKQFKEMEKINL